MSMYSREERMRAVELYIKYDKSAAGRCNGAPGFPHEGDTHFAAGKIFGPGQEDVDSAAATGAHVLVPTFVP
jgi:hypothetical protein